MSTRPSILELAGRFVPWVLVVGLVALAVTQIRGGGAAVADGTRAPALAVQTDDGSRVDLASERGKLLVLNFWGTFCPPCRAEAPVLQRAHAKLVREHRGRVLGVSVDRAPLAEVTAFARRLGMLYPIAIGPTDALLRYKVDVVPTTYVIGRDGLIVRSFVGAVSDGELADAL